jgi:hypothetical protein
VISNNLVDSIKRKPMALCYNALAMYVVSGFVLSGANADTVAVNTDNGGIDVICQISMIDGFNNGSDDTLLFNDFDNTENSSPVNPTKNNPFSFDTQPAILTQNYWRNKIEGKQRPKEPKSRGYSNRQQGFNHVQWVMAYKFH